MTKNKTATKYTHTPQADKQAHTGWLTGVCVRKVQVCGNEKARYS